MSEYFDIDEQFSDHPLASGRTAASEQDCGWPYVEKDPVWWGKMFHTEWIKDRPSGSYQLPTPDVIAEWFRAAMDRGRDNLLIEMTARDGNIFSKPNVEQRADVDQDVIEQLQHIVEIQDTEKRRRAFDWVSTEFGCCYIRELTGVVKNPRWDYSRKQFIFRNEADAALFRVFWG